MNINQTIKIPPDIQKQIAHYTIILIIIFILAVAILVIKNGEMGTICV